jgi:uncharacterized protein YndB with AHSA1/START domain
MTTTKKPNEISISRFYEAPVSAVWDAWTDPDQVGQWWGPRGFTITTHSKDLRTGGHWHYTMHGPDGADYVNKTKYLEVKEKAKLVYDHGGNDERKPLFRVTVHFTEAKGGTRMEMTMAFPTVQDAEQGVKFIKKAGGNATWDRLGEHLTKRSSGKDVFVINRAFDAPIDVMYEMWTNPKHVAQWLPPVGFTMKYLAADIRPGGKSSYSMTAENGGLTMYGRAEYLKLEKPHTLVYTQQFTDEKGNISRHPMLTTWPETMLTTVRLTEEEPAAAGKQARTRVTVTWEAYGKATPQEMAEFVKHRPSMTQGWTGAFDKLEDYLPATLGAGVASGK